MKASNDIHDFETLLDNTFGRRGTVEREVLETNAQAFCVGQMILDARKQERMTQAGTGSTHRFEHILYIKD